MKRIFTIIFVWLSLNGLAQVKDFALENVSSGKLVSLSDYTSVKGVVIIFTSNVCPYSVYYEGRITQLVADYGKRGVPFILINSHKEAKETKEEMANKISTWGLDVPYLADKEQTVMRQFGARKSPEIFLLKRNNSSFSVFYKGSIDNNPQVASDVKMRYLRENLEALLSGKGAIPGGRPVGCMIKG